MARNLAIGDIHGCRTALDTLVTAVAPGRDDTVITLGDYVDRGPDSRGVLDFLIEFGQSHRHVPLCGNHEIMMLDAREKKSWLQPWLAYGGEATLRSYAGPGSKQGAFDDVPQSHIDFLENQLLAYYECDSHFFVHACADANVALAEQSEPTLYWRKYRGSTPHCSGKVMVCGHTPQLTGVPRDDGHAICIDTWACGEGWLTCLDVDSGQIWQADESGATRDFSLDELQFID